MYHTITGTPGYLVQVQLGLAGYLIIDTVGGEEAHISDRGVYIDKDKQ